MDLLAGTRRTLGLPGDSGGRVAPSHGRYCWTAKPGPVDWCRPRFKTMHHSLRSHSREFYGSARNYSAGGLRETTVAVLSSREERSFLVPGFHICPKCASPLRAFEPFVWELPDGSGPRSIPTRSLATPLTSGRSTFGDGECTRSALSAPKAARRPDTHGQGWCAPGPASACAYSGRPLEMGCEPVRPQGSA